MAKYKVGDEVMVRGEIATVIEVVTNQRLADGSLGTLYGVRLTPWKKVVLFKDGQGQAVCRYEHPEGKTDEDGKVLTRDHEADTLGCLHEDDFE